MAFRAGTACTSLAGNKKEQWESWSVEFLSIKPHWRRVCSKIRAGGIASPAYAAEGYELALGGSEKNKSYCSFNSGCLQGCHSGTAPNFTWVFLFQPRSTQSQLIESFDAKSLAPGIPWNNAVNYCSRDLKGLVMNFLWLMIFFNLFACYSIKEESGSGVPIGQYSES